MRHTSVAGAFLVTAATISVALLCGMAVAPRTQSRAAISQAGTAGASPAQEGEPGKVLRLAFDALQVSNLERSVEYYKALGFAVETYPAAWTSDEATNRLFSTRGAMSRTAALSIANAYSGKPFTLYLREFKGTERKSWSDLTPWDPVANHFGLTVPDADALWTRLQAAGILWPRTWGGKLIPRPGQSKGGLAYIKDPDGMSVEIVGQRPATPTASAERLGLNHIGLVVLDSDKSKAFYGTLLGAQFPQTPSEWLSGDFYDSVVGSHGNILRLFNGTFAESTSPDDRMRLELVEFKNAGRKEIGSYRLSDIAVNCIGLEVDNLDTVYSRLRAAGVSTWSEGGIVKLQDGVRAVIVRNPDVGFFTELFERPQK